MASNRHLGRIISLQSLYEYEFREKAGDASADLDTIIAKNIEPYENTLGDTEFVYTLTRGVADKAKSLDSDLKPLAPEWPISTIAAIDRNVLRIGLYELKYCGDTVPPKVAINEAVELAKAFGSDNSSRFINGVLGTAFRQIDPEAATKDNHEQSANKKDDSEKSASSADDKLAAQDEQPESAERSEQTKSDLSQSQGDAQDSGSATD